MSTDEASCSDCKIEIIEKKWTKLLLNWINKCASPKTKVRQLDTKPLLDVINKYRNDICEDELDRMLLCAEDLEPFIKYKYPILRLRYLSEDKDLPKKMYILTSMLLYHCCASSQTGAVDSDICCKLSKTEQEWILKFCENLSDMETTINNVDCAIRGAFDFVMNNENQIVSAPSSKTEKTLSNSETLDDTSESSPETVTTKPPTPTLKFKSSITVMPSVIITDTSSCSKSSDMMDYSGYQSGNLKEETVDDVTIYNVKEIQQKEEIVVTSLIRIGDNSAANDMTTIYRGPSLPNCQHDCVCSTCSTAGPACGDAGSSMDQCKCSKEKLEDTVVIRKIDIISKSFHFHWKKCLVITAIVMLSLLLLALVLIPYSKTKKTKTSSASGKKAKSLVRHDQVKLLGSTAWLCQNNFCEKVYNPTKATVYFTSLSRCTLLCTGPPLWPHPIGYTQFSKKLVAIATYQMEYKFQSLPSETVHEYLAEAFKLFLGDLARLEKLDVFKNRTHELTLKKLNIQIHVETDPDPRIRLNTDESYTVKIESTKNFVQVTVTSHSFCGVRHGLETLSQMILLDQSSGYLITLTNAIVKDAPSYKYRGLMIDTARNFIPMPDLFRTIDAMSTCKLNTFHWRISGVTSFPFYVPEYPLLFEYGGYDRALMYNDEDIKALVRRAGIRGIRVVIEVAAPGPVGRPWSWLPEASCPKKNDNITCDNILCVRLRMKDAVFDILQTIYTTILELTRVEDVFHLSNGIFSLTNCYYLIDDREGFLDKALERLKLANKGFLPQLPIIWYTTHLTRDLEAQSWDRLGVQLNEWVQNPEEHYLSRYKVVHSSRWDLSCDVRKQRCTKYRTWQEMYAWKSWRTVESFTIEGGEATLWTDLVDSGNLDYHLWPRAAAVAERLWSDIVANASASGYTYARLDAQRWRMILRGIRVQPVWPLYCSFNPKSCINKLKT